MLTTAERIVFVLIILATAAAFLAPLRRRYRLVRAGTPENRFDRMAARVAQALSRILLQRCTLKGERPFTGLVHLAIFYGALTFDTMTVNHTLEGFFPGFFLFGGSRPGLLFSLAVDAFGILVLAAVFYFIIRRFLVRPPAYATTPLDSAVIYAALILVTVSYFYFEAFALAHEPAAARWSFLGAALGRTIAASGLGASAIAAHVKIAWWAHILFVYGFIAYVPHSKYLHMITGSVNLVFREPDAGKMLCPLDLENSEVFGLEKAADWSWKDRLDSLACMECGRCQDACPAFASGKPLSPKMIVFNMERHLLDREKEILGGNRAALPALVPSVHTEGEIWTCTTCGACMHVCPVEIEHIPKIVGARRSRVLMESAFPAELGPFFRNMETNANPWGIGFAKRADWAEGLGVRTIAEHPRAEILFWVGCAGSFDEEGKSIARDLAGLLNLAGVDYAILGTEEKCCGDSARRLGNEYLFQTLAAENLALFAKYKVREILTICPHGYNTFKNEYAPLVDRVPGLSAEDRDRLRSISVVHHAELLRTLVKDGRLAPGAGAASALAYHDPCYLGRHNGVLDGPRELLGRLNGRPPLELEHNREHSFCCGAGGGLMWTEESLGKRINHLRADEVIRAGASGVATACPFCLTMLKDALKDKDRGEIAVRDVATLLARSIAGETKG